MTLQIFRHALVGVPSKACSWGPFSGFPPKHICWAPGVAGTAQRQPQTLYLDPGPKMERIGPKHQPPSSSHPFSCTVKRPTGGQSLRYLFEDNMLPPSGSRVIFLKAFTSHVGLPDLLTHGHFSSPNLQRSTCLDPLFPRPQDLLCAGAVLLCKAHFKTLVAAQLCSVRYVYKGLPRIPGVGHKGLTPKFTGLRAAKLGGILLDPEIKAPQSERPQNPL